MAKKILLTGGAGYIGSHTYLALIEAGYDVVIFDNFSNAKTDVPNRLEMISGASVQYQKDDILDRAALASVFEAHQFDAVIHFAALKAVGESMERPLDYIETNCTGLLNLLQEMKTAGVSKLVFSSSATVYGDPEILPIPETAERKYTNPYGFTKLFGEQVLEQTQASHPDWKIGTLRYFNPVGAHPSGLIGEDPTDIPNNLMPYIAKVATDDLPFLRVFGDDYKTHDGTGVRDYIHVEDLAIAHVLSLNALFSEKGSHTVNIGTGTGYSVLDMLASYSKASGKTLPHQIHPRREGDVATLLADPSLAKEFLGFEASKTLDDMCESSWNWVSKFRNDN